MRVLVTGGAGFIGAHIVEALVARGTEVVALDALLDTVHADATALEALPDAVEFVRADVRDAAAVEEALRGVDVVCHQAAMVGLGRDAADLPQYTSCNDYGTAVLLAAMARLRVDRLVLASSMVVYGEGRYTCDEHGVVAAPARRDADLAAGRFEPCCASCGRPLAVVTVPEDAPFDPRNTYAVTKATQELLARSWARETQGSAIALRYHNVYGPGMPRDTPYSGVAALFRSALENGRPPRVFEDGRQLRDFVHVTDVAAANVRAIEACRAAPATGESTAYNIASGRPCRIGDVATVLAAAFGGPAPVVTGEYRLGDVRHVVADPAKASRDLGFTADVDWRDGVRAFARDPLRGTPLRRQQPVNSPE
jgi:dTDP-L-rhamnose 4-epimerase